MLVDSSSDLGGEKALSRCQVGCELADLDE